MPNIAYGDMSSKIGSMDLRKMKFDYDYPAGLNLRPGYDLHDKLVDKIVKRARDSASTMSNRFSAWNTIDHTLTTYIDLTDSEEDLKADNPEKPVSIVFPHSYAILETILGYLIAAFFQDPIFRYEATKPDGMIGGILMEKVIALQAVKNKMMLNLHTWYRDSLAYGFGVVTPPWKVIRGKKTVKKVTKPWFGPPQMSKKFVDAVLFEGNELNNIDPYLCLPDPNRPITELQKSEFFGWLEPANYLDLLTEERNEQDLFNVRYLSAIKGKRTSIYNFDNSGRNTKVNIGLPNDTAYTSPTDLLNMYVKLIPREWNIGDADYPKTYLFTVAADQILVRLKPLGLTHGMIPAAVIAPDYDGYTINPISRLEVLYGMQHTLDWMFNAHVANVRKAINDTIVYDPYLLNSNDLKDPKPGGLVRLRRAAWGRGVKDSFAQLGIVDVTRGHVADANMIVSIMDKAAGVDASTMGALRQGGPERLTGAEFKGTQVGTFTRLERIAKIIGVQGMQDLGYMFAHQTQQLMSEETYVNIAGPWQETLMREYGITDPTQKIKVSPFDILVDYDLKIRDGSVPGGNYSAVWVKMFEILASHPELLQKFDITRIFTHIARNEGAKNVERFVRVQQRPQEEVEQEEQAGNLVPITQLMEAQSVNQ
jgi:hypothetical protein